MQKGMISIFTYKPCKQSACRTTRRRKTIDSTALEKLRRYSNGRPRNNKTASPVFHILPQRCAATGRHLFLAENLIDVIQLSEKPVGPGTIKPLHHCPVISATIQRAFCRRRTRRVVLRTHLYAETSSSASPSSRARGRPLAAALRNES